MDYLRVPVNGLRERDANGAEHRVTGTTGLRADTEALALMGHVNLLEGFEVSDDIGSLEVMARGMKALK